jgi:hypothetical protein
VGGGVGDGTYIEPVNTAGVQHAGEAVYRHAGCSVARA